MKKLFKPKQFNSGMIGKTLAAGILFCALSCSTVLSVKAATFTDGFLSVDKTVLAQVIGSHRDSQGLINGNVVNESDAANNSSIVVSINPQSGAITVICGWEYQGPGDNQPYYSGSITLTDADLSALGIDRSKLSRGTTYTAGTGITIGSDNKVSVKPGTNVTVDGNGVSVYGNGSVGSGNTGLISGDTAYTELRSSANGKYVSSDKKTAENLKVLDDNLAALDNAIDDVVNSGLQFGANSGDDVTNKIGSKVSIIGGGTKADNEYDSKNIKTIIVQDENGNTQIEIDLDKNPEFASILTEGDANIGGKLNVTGDTHLKSDLTVDGDTNIGGNTSIQKDLEVLGNSKISGDTTIGNDDDGATLAVGKEGTENGKFVLNGTGDIKGDTTIGNDDDGATLAIGKEGTENGKFVLNGTGDIKGDTTIGNDDDGATLTVGKEGADNGKFVLNGDGNVTNTFTVGNGDPGDNLTVNGTTNLNGDTIIGSKEAKANLKVYGDSDVTSNGHYGGNLKVDGNADVGGTLTADKVIANDVQLPGGSLTGRLDNMDTRISKVGAGAAALAGLQYAKFEPGSKFSMAMGVGNYKSQTAMAIGGQYHFNRNTAMNIAATVGNGENMIAAGLTFSFGTPKSAYQKNNDALRAENDMLNKRLKAVEKKLESLSLITDKRAGFPDVDKGHWANKAVETLHGNGFVQGYPDGEFKGDRQMTRYEYAEMLYNALSKGAKVDQAQLEEYAPELHKINAERVRGNKPKNDKKSSQGITTTTVQQDADTQAFGQAYNANHPR